jgi:hypothetical protein
LCATELLAEYEEEEEKQTEDEDSTKTHECSLSVLEPNGIRPKLRKSARFRQPAYL